MVQWTESQKALYGNVESISINSAANPHEHDFSHEEILCDCGASIYDRMWLDVNPDRTLNFDKAFEFYAMPIIGPVHKHAEAYSAALNLTLIFWNMGELFKYTSEEDAILLVVPELRKMCEDNGFSYEAFEAHVLNPMISRYRMYFSAVEAAGEKR